MMLMEAWVEEKGWNYIRERYEWRMQVAKKKEIKKKGQWGGGIISIKRNLYEGKRKKRKEEMMVGRIKVTKNRVI